MLRGAIKKTGKFAGGSEDLLTSKIYYAPPSSPEGARCCPNRGNAGGALVFLGKLTVLLQSLFLFQLLVKLLQVLHLDVTTATVRLL